MPSFKRWVGGIQFVRSLGASANTSSTRACKCCCPQQLRRRLDRRAGLQSDDGLTTALLDHLNREITVQTGQAQDDAQLAAGRERRSRQSALMINQS